MALLLYQAKRAVFDRLAVLATTDARLMAAPNVDPVTVGYSRPGDILRRLIYGENVRFTREEGVAEYGVLQVDQCQVDVIFESYVPGDNASAADDDIEQMVEAMTDDFEANPRLAGGLSWIGVGSGQGFTNIQGQPEPAITGRLRLQVVVQGLVS